MQLNNYQTLSKFLNIPELQFLHLWNSDPNILLRSLGYSEDKLFYDSVL